MSSLPSIVSVTITSNSRGVSRKSFGVPMVVGKHDNWGSRYKEYTLGTALADLVSDGFSAYDPIYKEVQSLASNTPKPQKVIVGRLVTDFDQTTEITVDSEVTEGDVYSFTLISPEGVAEEISYTAQAGDDDDAIATAVAALITAVSGITSTAASEVISADADNSNEMWRFTGIDSAQFSFKDTTVDSSLATEIGEIDTLYPDTYGVLLADCPSKARLLAVAAWVETKEKIFGAVSYDHENLDPASVDSVGYALNAAGYTRTYGIFSNDQSVSAAAAWMGERFPFDPGSSTWCYKALSGVTVDVLTATQVGALEAVKMNYYTEVAGLNVTQTGKVASGEWIDVIRFIDWLTAQVRESVFGLLANAPKIPYTDSGVAMVTNVVSAVMQDGIGKGGLAADPAPIVTAPLVSTVSDANKISRLLPDVYFEGTLAGAIHLAQVAGVLKV